jgi:sodium/hydrogen antiporter
MAWEHLAINRPHLVYIILGGFTSIFMLCSLFIKEKLYIGEATVATICGIIFGPNAANLINPLEWGNVDQITLEFSRIVLVVQCFAVGVELPKSYMERHWKSVVFLLLPVMTYGWLVTSLFIWWMVEPLTWLESLIVAACVTATDPVLASSVVGKGKFAKRVPKHLRDLLSAESGCNDGMAFPFIYLSLYIARYRPDTNKVAFNWICYTILYECLAGAVYGFMVGYIARHAIKLAEKKGLIDRESFLVFYFVLALFCAGSGSMLGMDDLLIGFSAGVGFSNDGWFTEKTEESHVSNVIDLLLNLTYFVYFGTIIPWDQFNAPEYGMIPWRLVVLGILVIFFRRIPIMLALRPVIPDVKTWREALFAGHFGPIGVGAIFVAILARAELETGSTDPLAELPPPGSKDYNVIYLIWPITCFLVILSIAIHGSSIAVFTLGKRINTLTLTLSYTQDNDVGRSWMDRLPRISASNSKSLSRVESISLESESNEKLQFPPGTLGPTGVPGNFLRRQKDDSEKAGTAPIGKSRKKRKWEAGRGPGGPISQSAIKPQRRSEPALNTFPESGSNTSIERSADVSPDGRQSLDAEKPSASSSTSPERGGGDKRRPSADVEVYEEGDDMIIEDEEGNVLSATETGGQPPEEKASKIEQERRKLAQEESGEHAKHKHEPHEKTEGEEIEKAVAEAAGHPYKNLRKQLGNWRGWGKSKEDDEGGESSHQKAKPPERKRGPAHAYQFGNTIIVEDEDGEVIKTYTLPAHDKQRNTSGEPQAQGWRRMSNAADMRRGLGRMGTWVGMSGEKSEVSPDTAPATSTAPAEPEAVSTAPKKNSADRHEQSADFYADNSLRFTISHIDRHGHGRSGTSGTSNANGITTGSGRRYSAIDFLKELQQMDPKAQIKAINDSNAPDHVKTEMRRVAGEDKESSQTRARQNGRQKGDTMPSGSAAVGQRPGAPGRSASDIVSSPSPSSRGNRPKTRRAGTEGITPAGSAASNSRSTGDNGLFQRPVPARRGTTASTVEEEDEEEEPQQEIPTHDVGSSLARLRKDRGTAADDRRQRLSTIVSRGSREDAATGQNREASGGVEVEDEEAETAAEKRRRLAALGVSEERAESESDEEQMGSPRRHAGRNAVTAGGEDDDNDNVPTKQGRPRETMVPEPKPRVQWGGVSGRETAEKNAEAQKDDDTAGNGEGSGAARKGIKGLFAKKH